MCRERLELFRVRLRMRLLPAPPKEDVRLRRIHIEAVAVRSQESDRLLPRVPVPGLPVKSFDDAELWLQMRVSGVIGV